MAEAIIFMIIIGGLIVLGFALLGMWKLGKKWELF